MKLLFQSTLRHMRQHGLQAFLTFIVTLLITAMVSVVFHFASSFQQLLREHALEEVGDYHYRYSTNEENSPYTAMMYRQMADAFRQDSWFKNVTLTEQDDTVSLELTVASPGLFTSRTMQKKFDAMEKSFREETGRNIMLMTRSDHNNSLLASYGDLDRGNGIYSYLIVFLLLFTVIAVTALLTLGAVFQVSASRREREFALFRSIGADSSQIRNMVLLESACYICFALPAGYLLGIFLFQAARGSIDDLLASLEKFPPIRLTISVPFSVALFICAALVILGSGFLPAVKAAKISPMELLHRNRDVKLSYRERDYSAPAVRGLFGVEGWLARKSHKRFKRRRRPVLLALSVALVLCFVLAGFRKFTTDVMTMSYRGSSYNIIAELYSNDREALEQLAQEAMTACGESMELIREAGFYLHSPYPLSRQGTDSGFGSGSGIVPGVWIISINRNAYVEICQELGVEPAIPAEGRLESAVLAEGGVDLTALAEGGAIEGIYLGTEGIWRQDGITYQGNPFEIRTGDCITMYQEHDDYSGQDGNSHEQENGIEISVVGVLDRWPRYTEMDEVTRIMILVPEETFLMLEPLSPYGEFLPGSCHVSLRQMAEDPYYTEEVVTELLNRQSQVTGYVSNSEKRLQREQASIAGFQYLCAALILLLALVCVFGNFAVSWTVNNARQKEFSTLVSVGMKPVELRKMKNLELLQGLILAFIPGFLGGMLCYSLIFRAYSTEYRLHWNFPWGGLLLGLAVLCLSTILTELAVTVSGRNRTMADMLRMEE